MPTHPLKQSSIKPLSPKTAIKLTSGRDFWSTEALPGIPSIRMSDGPHGLRYQATAGDHLGINEALAATAFPTASASASSWDPELLTQMGAAIGREARRAGVDVVLGPGINIKRDPRGGRNFEYFSEDPFLTGQLAISWINGLQSQGVGASLKHFAGNSQETDRLRADSLIDPTALHELYLEAFRLAVTSAKPESVMIAYNRLNGIYMSDHAYLLTTVLQKQWGFDGLVVTDWGALNDKVAALNAGTDLEMPSSGHLFDHQALASKRIEPAALDRAVKHIRTMAMKVRPQVTEPQADLWQQHGQLAQTIEEQSAVLMKNDGILPLDAGKSLTVIGALGNETRIQGAGSSHITTPETISIVEGLTRAGHQFSAVPGYRLDDLPAPELVQEAIQAAQHAEQVVMVMGLPDTAEAEGRDRDDLALPSQQVALLHAVAQANHNVVVLLVAGSVVTTPWASEVKAILNLFLGGQRVGAAAERLLFGKISPSGKLAETYPQQLSDLPTFSLYNRQPHSQSVPYAESLYVGYRYADKANLQPAFPFGFGLSYTTFSLKEIQLHQKAIQADPVTVEVTVHNTGNMRGAEVVQVYVGPVDQDQLVPVKILAAFQKVWLAPGAQQVVTLTLPTRAFKRWDDIAQEFRLAGGEWEVSVGTASRSIAQTFTIQVTASAFKPRVPDWYRQPHGQPRISDFTALTGVEIKPDLPQTPGHFSALSTPRALSQYSRVSRRLAKFMIARMQQQDGVSPSSPEGQFLATIVWDTPLIRLAQQSGGSLKLWMVAGLVFLANHKFGGGHHGK